MDEQLKYKIALSLIPNIGDVLAKKILAYCGSLEGIFKEKKAGLLKIPGIGEVLASSILQQKVFDRVDEEIKFIDANDITPLFYFDENYPKRLKHCSDSPIMLYQKGTINFNTPKVISIVGTRKATHYGKKICEKLIEDLAPYNVSIISGLAYGIDIIAHKAAIDNNLPTAAVLAHGLDQLYPALHKSVAEKMLMNGALLSDFTSKTKPNKENFPSRNRIVAGIADATVVIESGAKGGSLITADIASSYNRDVFAFPGRVEDEFSVGCNNLIKTNKAALIQSAADIIFMMGWEAKKDKKIVKQKTLFFDLNEEEKIIVALLKEKEKINIDDLCFTTQLSMSKIAALLLNLEFSGLIQSLPGKMYQLQ